MFLNEYLEKVLEEKSSTEKAKETLQAIIDTTNKSDSDSSQEIYKMATEMMDYYRNEGSFSPDQAKWIFNTSQAIFNK